MSSDHVMKECPELRGFKCDERGHFARNCTAVLCPDCNLTLNKCECWIEDEEEQQVNRQMHIRTVKQKRKQQHNSKMI